MEKHDLLLYLQDVTSLLLQVRTERPIEFIADYFSSIMAGAHVIMRDFQYVNASERNRWAFVRLSLESFAEFPSDSPITSIELANLLRMLCPDFPLELVENTALLCGESDEHPFHTFLDATLMRFYYAEFFDRTAEVFSTCDTRSTGSVNRNVLLLTLRQMARRTTCTCPPKYIFDQVFDDVSKLGSFEGIGQPSDVQLLEMQSALLRAPAMYEKLNSIGDPMAGSLISTPTRHKPPAGGAANLKADQREAHTSPGTPTGKGARKPTPVKQMATMRKLSVTKR